MARKANPEVQVKKLDEAFGRLDKQTTLVYVRHLLNSMDKKSLLMGGIVEALDLYYEKEFGEAIPAAAIRIPETADWQVGESLLSDRGLIDMALGFGQAETTEQAAAILTEQGFTVERIAS